MHTVIQMLYKYITVKSKVKSIPTTLETSNARPSLQYNTEPCFVCHYVLNMVQCVVLFLDYMIT